MPSFLLVVLVLSLIAVVAMFVVRSRKAEVAPRRRSKQRADREAAQAKGSAAVEAAAATSDDAPRMPMGELPPRPSRHRR